MSREPASVFARAMKPAGYRRPSIVRSTPYVRDASPGQRGAMWLLELGLTKPTTTLQWYADWLPGTQKA